MTITNPTRHPRRQSRHPGLLGLLLASVGAVGAAHAGIFRDVLAKVGIVNDKPPVNANGDTIVFPREGYLCCNLHRDGSSASDSNYATLPDVLKAGTRVTVVGYGRNRANIDVDGTPMELDHDYGRDQESLDAWMNKMVIPDDPRGRASAASATVKAAISESKVVLGMTRQQVLLSVGYPPTNLTKSTDDTVWRLWAARHAEYQLHFGADGRLISVTGDGEITQHVIYLPTRH
jgi:hypothetical protein